MFFISLYYVWVELGVKQRHLMFFISLYYVWVELGAKQ
jgi:hypothetical protein